MAYTYLPCTNNFLETVHLSQTNYSYLGAHVAEVRKKESYPQIVPTIDLPGTPILVPSHHKVL
jgi:hypothetical protein